MFGFEKLIVWQKAKELSLFIYRITSKSSFPEEEKYNIVSQMRRCSISVSSNIAEGTSRSLIKDKHRFITVAYGSSMELVNQAIIANEPGYISQADLDQTRDAAKEICAMLSGLKKNIK